MQNEHTTIQLSDDDVREGLRLERAAAAAHDLLHVAQNDLNRYVAHLGALYAVPEGWTLKDWMRGFGPPGEQGAANGAGPERLGHTHG